MYRHPERDFGNLCERSQFTSIFSTVFRYAKLLVPYFKRYRLKFQPFKLELMQKKETFVVSFIILLAFHERE